MKQVLLDTNFIVACARQKIDFFHEIPFMGFEILIPEQIFDEIKKLSKSKESSRIREEADLALKILNRSKFTSIKLRRNNVDDAIVEFAEANPEAVIATMDKELKSRIKNQKMVIKDLKTLQIL